MTRSSSGSADNSSGGGSGGGGGFSQCPCRYFLIVYRLFETLDQRIQRWSITEDLVTIGIDECKEEFNCQYSINKKGGRFGMKDELLDECLSIGTFVHMIICDIVHAT